MFDVGVVGPSSWRRTIPQIQVALVGDVGVSGMGLGTPHHSHSFFTRSLLRRLPLMHTFSSVQCSVVDMVRFSRAFRRVSRVAFRLPTLPPIFETLRVFIAWIPRHKSFNGLGRVLSVSS